MSSIGTGYDLSAATYSPEGRVFQIEYANKAVENSSTAIGVRCKDGIVMGVEKLVISKMLVDSSNRRIFNIDYHVGMSVSGLVADARQLVNKARKECRDYKSFYGMEIPIKLLAERLASEVHYYTLHGWVRPYGTSIILSGLDNKKTPQLYLIEPTGVVYGYYACAAGKGVQLAKTKMEELDLKNMTALEAVSAVTKIIYQVHDDVKDKDFILELSWACEQSGGKHEAVPEDIRSAIIEQVKHQIEQEEMGEDEEDAE